MASKFFDLLPDGYGYVFAGLCATGVANMYLMYNVATRRRKYGIKYPALYADASHVDEKTCKPENVEEFNCAQRAHQNTLESMATVQVTGSLTGLLYPYYSAICLGIFSIGRIMYGYGYVTKGPEGRKPGFMLSFLSSHALTFCAGYCALKLLEIIA